MSTYRIEFEVDESTSENYTKRAILLALNKLVMDITYTSGLDPIVIRAPDGAYRGIASLVTDDHGGN